MDTRYRTIVLAGLAGLAVASPALGQEAAEAAPSVTAEVAFIFNSFSFLVSGLVVMFMAAGFAMLEAGLVRAKNVSTILLKNIALYSIAGVMFYLCGYNLMYGGSEGGFIGDLTLWSGDGVGDAFAADLGTGYAAGSDWFFQMVFVATAASVVSGTIAERSKLWGFLLFSAVLAGFIYPIAGKWEWGAGWLDAMGFSDFAGSTLVHSVGGWAALTGALIIGARRGKYGPDGRVNPIPGSSMPLAALGTFILWFGWFGFNGGSQLALGSAADVAAMSRIFINTNLAAAAGLLTAMAVSQIRFRKVDLSMALNGAIGGLVSITAEPLMPEPWMAIAIGAVGGVLVMYAVPVLDKLKIDDVVGAISVHLVCGIWGTMAVPLTNPDASFGVQAIGVLAYGAFVTVTSALVWFVLKFTVGIRVTAADEEMGLDKAELGMEAYPEFNLGVARADFGASPVRG